MSQVWRLREGCCHLVLLSVPSTGESTPVSLCLSPICRGGGGTYISMSTLLLLSALLPTPPRPTPPQTRPTATSCHLTSPAVAPQGSESPVAPATPHSAVAPLPRPVLPPVRPWVTARHGEVSLCLLFLSYGWGRAVSAQHLQAFLQLSSFLHREHI